MPELNWIYDENAMIWTAELDGIRAIVTAKPEHKVFLARVEPPAGSPLQLAPMTFDSPEAAQNWCHEFIHEQYFHTPDEQSPLL